MSNLAIDGGKPVRTSLLPYGHQSIDSADIQAVINVLNGDWLTTGPFVQKFERAVAGYLGATEAVAVNSGTAALHTAAFAAGIGNSDEVIVPALTFVASANCVLYLGGRPIFADILPGTLNVDPADIERKITQRTKAIVSVDFAGQPCNYQAIREIATRYHLVVIEDAAHALGATYCGNKVGTLNEYTTLSFHPVKHITTGEGGMIVTDDASLAAKMRAFRSHGITTDFKQRADAGSWIYEMVALGFNYRISDLNCALGISQLTKLDSWLIRRREIAARYNKEFVALSNIEVPTVLPDCESAWHLYVIRLNLERLRVGRAEIFKALRAENIGVNVHYIPVPWHPYYQKLGYTKGQWPVAEAAYERLISLPIFPTMSDQDVHDVIDACFKVIEAYRK